MRIGNFETINFLPVRIGTYSSLIGNKKIEVLTGPDQKICGRVIDASNQASELLPLQGLPISIARESSLKNLQRYFSFTHLTPERGVDNRVNRISVTVTGKGGVTSKIPFQEGLALGSVVPGDTVIKFIKYADAVGNNERLEAQLRAAEARLEYLGAKIKSVRERSEDQNPTLAEEALVTCWSNEIGRLTTQLDQLGQQIADPGQDIPIIANFSSGLETPVDLKNSTFTVQPRGFDSLKFNSQYISMTEDLSKIHDVAKESSSTNSLAAGGGIWLFKANASQAWSSATAKRLTEIKKEGKSEGVLMINASTTTRHVRCFTDFCFDRDKLQMVIDAMDRNDQDEIKRCGITVAEDGSKSIYILSEAVMGGAFTALVTFSKESNEEREVRLRSKESSSHTSVGAEITVPMWHNLSIGGGFGRASDGGKQSEDDQLQHTSSTRVNIEIVSQGVTPTFEREILEQEVLKHLNFDPSKFKLSTEDKKNVKKMLSHDAKKRDEAVLEQNMKMGSVQMAAVNAIRGVISSKDRQKLHTPESVMQAYESFAGQMAEDPHCGVPVGFNYRVFTEHRLREKFAQLNAAEREVVEDE